MRLQSKNFPNLLDIWVGSLLWIWGTKQLGNLPDSICLLKSIVIVNVSDLRLLEQDVDLKYLRKLNLSGCGILEVPKSLGCLTSLEALDLSGNNFVRLPTNISELYELQYLGLRYCRRLGSLQKLPPRLAKLDAHSYTFLRTVPRSSTIVDGNIFEFIFTNCPKLAWDCTQQYHGIRSLENSAICQKTLQWEFSSFCDNSAAFTLP